MISAVAAICTIFQNQSNSKLDETVNINNIDNSQINIDNSQINIDNSNNITYAVTEGDKNTTEIISSTENITGYTQEMINEIDVENIVMSESGYSEYLSQLVEVDIIYKYYNDYDGDGDCELFAVVGEETDKVISEQINLTGEIWFVDINGAKLIEKSEKNYWTKPTVFSVGGKSFIAFEEAYVTGSLTYIWGVKDNEPYQPNISGKGHGLSINDYNEIELCCSKYDGSLYGDLMSGHTWKNYYFYFDGNSFKEYGGIKITVTDLLKLNGTEEIVNDIIEDGYTIDSIFYRGNGIININKSLTEGDSTDYANITVRCIGERVEIVNSIWGKENEGIYEAAFIPAVATYPDCFPY